MYSKEYKVARGHSRDTRPAKTIASPSIWKVTDKFPENLSMVKVPAGLFSKIIHTMILFMMTAVSIKTSIALLLLKGSRGTRTPAAKGNNTMINSMHSFILISSYISPAAKAEIKSINCLGNIPIKTDNAARITRGIFMAIPASHFFNFS